MQEKNFTIIKCILCFFGGIFTYHFAKKLSDMFNNFIAIDTNYADEIAKDIKDEEEFVTDEIVVSDDNH